MNTLQIATTIINIVCIAVLLIIFFAGQRPCQQDNIPDALNTTRFVHLPALNMPMRSKEAANRRKEEQTMVAGTLAREKEAAKRRMQEEAAAAQVTLTTAPTALGDVLPVVVSPPSATHLNSLLTGHVGQESVSSHKDGIALTSMEEDLANSTDKITKNKKAKKVKSSKDDKEDKATMRD
jgi:hypothetical protein